MFANVKTSWVTIVIVLNVTIVYTLRLLEDKI